MLISVLTVTGEHTSFGLEGLNCVVTQIKSKTYIISGV